MPDSEGRGAEPALVGVAGMSGLFEVGLPFVGEVDQTREVADDLEARKPGAGGRKGHRRQDCQAASKQTPREQAHS